MDEARYRQEAQARALREILAPMLDGGNPTLNMSGTVGGEDAIPKVQDKAIEDLVRRRMEQVNP